MWTDPTGGAIIGGGAPHVLDWVHRMLWRERKRVRDMGVAGAVLMPILTTQVGENSCRGRWPTRKLLPRRGKNSASRSATIFWTQKPQKYHARSLGMLRARYAAVADKAALDPVLEAAGCLAGLRA